jgi:hypothetical protein
MRRLLLPLIVATFAASVANASGALIESDGSGLYKPRSFCPSNHTCFSDARWIRWESVAVAWAYGTTQYPGGPAFRQHQKVEIRLSRVRRICGGERYTRVSWRYPGTAASIRAFFEPLTGGCGFWTGA